MNKTINGYNIIKTKSTCDRGTFVVVQKPKGKLYFGAFISNAGTLTITSTIGWDSPALGWSK